MILEYGNGMVGDVESSYKRSVMKKDGVESFLDGPSRALKYLCEGNI